MSSAISLPVPWFSTQVFSSSDPPARTTTPEEFIRMTKGITMATAKAVAAGNSCRQEDIIATANLSRRAIADMLHSCKVHRTLMSRVHNTLSFFRPSTNISTYVWVLGDTDMRT